MWTLINKTPYAAERTWVLDKNAVKSWVVVVKATFDIASDGRAVLASRTAHPMTPSTARILRQVSSDTALRGNMRNAAVLGTGGRFTP